MRVTRRYRFAASHRLDSPRLAPEQNRQVYGKCNHPYGHGHDYLLEVRAQGPVNPETGLALDVPKLDALVREQVLAPFDHSNLNLDSPAFQEAVPTTENLALEIRRRLQACWDAAIGPPARLDSIHLRETKRNSVEV